MANKWITHVKQYAAQHGISYPEAMVKARASYKPTKKLKGGQTLKDFGLEQYNKIPEQYHPGIESLGRAGLSQMGFGMKSKRKIKGGQTLKDFGLEQYNKIPAQYHPGIESLGRAGLSQMGFGLKKRKPRKKGGDIFSDIGNAFRPVADVFRPVVDSGRRFVNSPTVKAVANNPLVKALAKKVAKEVLKYGVEAAGPAAAAAAIASGNPELAIPAAALAIELANEAKPIGDNYIDGLGLRTRKTRRGKALMPAGAYGP
jgi:hypothetical protein